MYSSEPKEVTISSTHFPVKYKIWSTRPSIVFEMFWSDNTRSYHNQRDLMVISNAFKNASPELHIKFLEATSKEANEDAIKNNSGEKMLKMLFGVPQPSALVLRS